MFFCHFPFFPFHSFLIFVLPAAFLIQPFFFDPSFLLSQLPSTAFLSFLSDFLLPFCSSYSLLLSFFPLFLSPSFLLYSLSFPAVYCFSFSFLSVFSTLSAFFTPSMDSPFLTVRLSSLSFLAAVCFPHSAFLIASCLFSSHYFTALFIPLLYSLQAISLFSLFFYLLSLDFISAVED
jgi:hypothetical protein